MYINIYIYLFIYINIDIITYYNYVCLYHIVTEICPHICFPTWHPCTEEPSWTWTIPVRLKLLASPSAPVSRCVSWGS